MVEESKEGKRERLHGIGKIKEMKRKERIGCA